YLLVGAGFRLEMLGAVSSVNKGQHPSRAGDGRAIPYQRANVFLDPDVLTSIFRVMAKKLRKSTSARRAPGEIRDSIIDVLRAKQGVPVSVAEIQEAVSAEIGPVSPSSVRSYLRLGTPGRFLREGRGLYRLRESSIKVHSPSGAEFEEFFFGKSRLVRGDCFEWLGAQPDNSIHAIVTDPPYGLQEFSVEQLAKLRAGKGGVWRVPPSFDGHRRSPLPRFTVLGARELRALRDYFLEWGAAVSRVLVPGANVVVASNPLVSYLVSGALWQAGLERRGEII